MSSYNPNVQNMGEVRRALQKIKSRIDKIKNTIAEYPVEKPNGTITNFSTSKQYDPGSLRVFVNGVQQEVNTHYSEDSDYLGYTFLVGAPKVSWYVFHVYDEDFEA